MAHAGEAANYYNGQQDSYYQMQSPAKYPPPQQYPPPQHPPPPQYGQNYGPPPPQQNGTMPGYGNSEKQDFEQTFKIESPKWNDWWAGVLVGRSRTEI